MALTPITDEEKKRLIFGLKSSVVATRFLTIKKIYEMVEKQPEKFRYLEVSDETSMRDILNLLEYISQNDPDAVLRREASISLSALRSILGPRYRYEVIVCEGCGEMLTFNWLFCPKCGEKIDVEKLKSSFETCEKCGIPISSRWNFCVRCGVRLKEEMAESRCPNCKKEIKPEWVICPYCGTRLKQVG